MKLPTYFIWCAVSGFLAGALGAKSRDMRLAIALVLAIVLFNLVLGKLLFE